MEVMSLLILCYDRSEMQAPLSIHGKICGWNVGAHLEHSIRVRISARVRESTLAKTPANESTRVQLDSRRLSDVSHKLNTGESKDSCKLHPGESKWTLVALYEILPLSMKSRTFSKWEKVFRVQSCDIYWTRFVSSYVTRYSKRYLRSLPLVSDSQTLEANQ